MANKKKWKIYKIPDQAGTKTLKEFIDSNPSADDLGQLLGGYAQKDETKDRVAGVELLLATKNWRSTAFASR
jgi:hypothetical protein